MAQRPRLINPKTLTIEPLNVATPPLDSLARQSAIREPRGTAITIRAQLDFGAGERSRIRDGLSGADEASDALAVLRRADCDAAVYVPRMGDKVTSITDRQGRTETAALYVMRARKSAPWRGGFSTWLLDLQDRSPAKSPTL